MSVLEHFDLQAASAWSSQQTAAAKMAFRVGFLLVEGFSMMAFTSAIEPLRAANRQADQTLYEWAIFSQDGLPVTPSNGIPIVPHAAFGDAPALDMVFVCSGIKGQQFIDPGAFKKLRAFARAGTVIGGLSSGPHILAAAGLLRGYRCTIHWEDRASFVEDFPDIEVTENLFEIDRDRYTCSGGIAALDMMLEIIRRQQGIQIAEAVGRLFIHDQIRGGGELQRAPMSPYIQEHSTKLGRVTALMEANLETPLPLCDIARHTGLTIRHMERLFRSVLGASPAKHYMTLRLEHARHLLRKTNLPIYRIAVAAGFVSASHFGRLYKNAYHCTPAEDRKNFSRVRFDTATAVPLRHRNPTPPHTPK